MMLTDTAEKTASADESIDGDGPSSIHLPRSSGLLLHVTSLPSRFGIGDMGPNAHRFADFLADTGQRIWQVLPLVPAGLGNSPYSSPSTFALNPLFVSPDFLVQEGLLGEMVNVPAFSEDEVDFASVAPYKDRLLTAAFERFSHRASEEERSDFDGFCLEQAYWLDDYALFMALKNAFEGTAWTEWPSALAGREPDALALARAQHDEEIRRRKFYQYLSMRQWTDLKRYCNERTISLFGDLPIYVAHDSADVWAHRDLFFLDESGRSTVVSGVPPDYFSTTGQRWGNPLYRWDTMKENGFDWWTRRFEHIFTLVDLIRLDHFRAFAGYWEIPASEETAIHGRWVSGPGASLFHAVEGRLGPLPVVAENLGMITPDVTDLMNEFNFPGMAVLQFAFGESADHIFLPHNLDRNVVAYTGTHDNDTISGWWEHLVGDPSQAASVPFVSHYLGLDAGLPVHWASIRAVMASHASFAVFPLQDLLGLGSDARMNTPGEGEGNWTWRFRWEQLTPGVQSALKTLTAVFGRSDKLREIADAEDRG